MKNICTACGKPLLVLLCAVQGVWISPPLAIGAPRAEVVAQSPSRKVTGRVVDTAGEPVVGATVMIEGTTSGMMVEADGTFSLRAAEGQNLVVGMLGYESRTVRVTDREDYLVILKESTTEMEEVTVVAFSKQKKESVISSVSTVRPSELKVPSSNLTTVLGGRIAGIISQQVSGEPGQDNADFFVRGVTTFNSNARGPLILIDNVELSSNDLARLQPDDIASFSILKDATATALYGARGANGVILVTTKEGREGKAQLNVRFENSFSMPTREVEVVDPVTYMQMWNEAVATRNPLAPRPYSDKKIEMTRRGGNSAAYPAVDWLGDMFKSYTTNQRVNLNLSGGGKVARYYVAGSLANDTGLMKVDERNNFNNNISLQTIQLRSNININVTKSTELGVRFSGTFEDYSGPIDGGSTLYKKALVANPVLFPKYFEKRAEEAQIEHILFGNAGEGNYLNPYADMVKGYKEYSKMNLVAQMELKQRLDFITEGLNARALLNTTRYSYFDVSRYYNPFYYSLGNYDQVEDTYKLTCLNPEGGTEYLKYEEGGKDIQTSTYFEAAVDYNRTFGERHAVSGLMVFTLTNRLYANQGDLQKSLAYRNVGLAGRFTYAYDRRYFVEANFGYNGSERFARKERFGFFPSVGLGWIISNEKFFGERLRETITLLKLKGTLGLVGNDQIGSADDRFFYLSNVNLDAGTSNYFGENFALQPSGVSISRYANPDITWETARKMNVGIELGLWDKVTIQADYFREKRTNILMDRASIPSTMGLQAPLRANVGEASSSGYEITVDANHAFNRDYWISGRFNMTYASGRYDVFEEPDYGYPWLSWVGKRLNQPTGLIAERLFIDEADIANSPVQTFGEVMPGDIKYKDINDDGIINGQDVVPIGHPTIPNYIFGFGFSAGIKGFDVSCFFQAAAETSFWIDSQRTAPFVDLQGDFAGSITSNGLLRAWADDHWSETNRNSYAQWPRLSPTLVSNNSQNSTWWLRDGSYLRLKSVEVGYTLPERWTRKIGIKSMRIYMNGLNLLTWSSFKLWDVEMGGNGLNYPIQKIYNLGLNVNF